MSATKDDRPFPSKSKCRAAGTEKRDCPEGDCPSLFFEGFPTVDFFLYCRVKDEKVVDDEEGYDEGEAGDVAP